MKLQELGEFRLIDRIAQRVKKHGNVTVGIGDDAAVTVPQPGMVVLTSTDMLVEGIHFDLSFCSPRLLGRKSLSVNLSDIAAMGAVPREFFLSLAIPPTMPVEFIDMLTEGMMERADQYDVALIGGDTCSSPNGLIISITIVGYQRPERVVRRVGARLGDLICVTGTLGDSALGLKLLQKRLIPQEAADRHLDPVPRVLEGRAIAEAAIATAMIDVSDGLLADLGHILDLSEVGARIELPRLPLSTFYKTNLSTVGTTDGWELALTGGEDYELLFTIPPFRGDELQDVMTKIGAQVSVIGEITDSRTLEVIDESGLPYRVKKSGYNHFKIEQ